MGLLVFQSREGFAIEGLLDFVLGCGSSGGVVVVVVKGSKFRGGGRGKSWR